MAFIESAPTLTPIDSNIAFDMFSVVHPSVAEYSVNSSLKLFCCA